MLLLQLQRKGKSIVKVRIFMQNEGSICVVKVVNDFDGKLIKKEGKLITTKKMEDYMELV